MVACFLCEYPDELWVSWNRDEELLRSQIIRGIYGEQDAKK
jgi:hypothetical protein